MPRRHYGSWLVVNVPLMGEEEGAGPVLQFTFHAQPQHYVRFFTLSEMFCLVNRKHAPHRGLLQLFARKSSLYEAAMLRYCRLQLLFRPQCKRSGREATRWKLLESNLLLSNTTAWNSLSDYLRDPSLSEDTFTLCCIRARSALEVLCMQCAI